MIRFSRVINSANQVSALEGELHAAALTLKEAYANGVFQLFDALRDRWLRRVQALGCSGERARPGDPAQGFQVDNGDTTHHKKWCLIVSKYKLKL